MEVTYDLRWFFVFLAVIYVGFGVSVMVVGADLGAGREGSGTTLAQAVFVHLYTMIYGECARVARVAPRVCSRHFSR